MFVAAFFSLYHFHLSFYLYLFIYGGVFLFAILLWNNFVAYNPLKQQNRTWNPPQF